LIKYSNIPAPIENPVNEFAGLAGFPLYGKETCIWGAVFTCEYKLLQASNSKIILIIIFT
jgi:hypothetical protein